MRYFVVLLIVFFMFVGCAGHTKPVLQDKRALVQQVDKCYTVKFPHDVEMLGSTLEVSSNEPTSWEKTSLKYGKIGVVNITSEEVDISTRRQYGPLVIPENMNYLATHQSGEGESYYAIDLHREMVKGKDASFVRSLVKKKKRQDGHAILTVYMFFRIPDLYDAETVTTSKYFKFGKETSEYVMKNMSFTCEGMK